MLVLFSQNYFANVGFHLVVKLWIKPYVSTAVFSLRRWCCELDIFVETAVLKCVIAETSAGLSRNSLSKEMLDIILFIMAGIFLVIEEGFFDCL